jgi:uncharacterized membrane protein YhaH (DUF805 family)
MDAGRIRFLYREEQGRIDRATWLRGAGALIAVLAPLTLVWLALEPYTTHDLAKTPFFAAETIAAYAYIIFYSFVVLLIAISFVNLSAKRFRDRGRTAPLGFASLAPLAALLAGALHFVQPRLPEVFARWHVWGADIALLGVVAWTVYELGYDPPKGAGK